jgi:large subunit ribosomal protein L2
VSKLLFKFFFTSFFKKHLIGLRATGGRNFLGRVCVYHKGSGNKLRFRQLDRFRRLNQYGLVLKVFKSKVNLPFVGMVLYDNGLLSFISVADGIFVGSRLFSGYFFTNRDEILKNGSSILLKHFGLFTKINSLEIFPFSGFKVARAAGCSAFIVGKVKNKAIIKLSSGWQISVSDEAAASYGVNSNVSYVFGNFGKAGKNRARGIRPTVRGIAKNPCDHPHGGGEGRGSPPAAAVTPWGFFTKGTPTKNRKFNRAKRRLFKTKIT